MPEKIQFVRNRFVTDTTLIGKDLKDYWEDKPEADLDWKDRYSYEAELISNYKYKTVLDIGSGPGGLCQVVMEKPNIIYHLIDTKSAGKLHKERNYKGEFFVKDLENDFNTDGLLESYDMIIMNDFLEHIRNPSLIMTNLLDLMHEKSHLLISIPNWRMGHGFFYPGLFDFDNIALFFHQHKYKLLMIYDSPLKCGKTPKLQSESSLPDGLLDSWNWYFVLKK